MPTSLSDTITRLAASQMRFGQKPAGGDGDRLSDIDAFGSNPGNLRARCFVPADLPANAPLVVVLHGCTQTAAGYDQGSGWSMLAERHGFALLYPEQQRANNPNLCFNWFVADDIRRDGGEALSIRQMIARMSADHAIDEARIFVTGLSAGGAMTSVMLATWPEVFAGGAIVAGLPFGTASSVSQALDRMRGQGLPEEAALGRLVTAASAFAGPWPTLSIWHGSADQTVAVANMDAIVAQWRGLHGLSVAPTSTESLGAHERRLWTDTQGRDCIETYRIAGMGHGTPIDPTQYGTAMPFMLPVGISSTSRIAAFWGIAGKPAAKQVADAAQPIAAQPTAAATARPGIRPVKIPAIAPAVSGIAKTIEDALRAAGLMR